MLFVFINVYWCPTRFPYQMMFVSYSSGVMVSLLASSVVDHGFENRSDQTKDYEIGIYCDKQKQKKRVNKTNNDIQHSTENKNNLVTGTTQQLGNFRSTSGIWRVRNERWATLWWRQTKYIRGHLWHKYNNNTWSTSASYYYNLWTIVLFVLFLWAIVLFVLYLWAIVLFVLYLWAIVLCFLLRVLLRYWYLQAFRTSEFNTQ